MISYAAKDEFPPQEQVLLEKLSELIPRIPEEIASPIRCHELTRAVARLYGLAHVDGHYGRTEHSWLYTRLKPRASKNYILDVYAVGRLPMVQLVDAYYYRDTYIESTERTDIDHNAVEQILGCLSSWSHQWKIVT
jgi:hypothetical protein